LAAGVNTWDMALHVVVAAVLHKDGKVLLCHRSPTRRWYPDVWDFPGGHVESGENRLDALARELHEELGILLLEVGPEPIIMKVDEDLDLTVWVCTSWQGDVHNLQPDEHDEVGWFARAELARLPMADPAYLPALEGLFS
jgi:8-oxo-dGTP diphosphatase